MLQDQDKINSAEKQLELIQREVRRVHCAEGEQVYEYCIATGEIELAELSTAKLIVVPGSGAIEREIIARLGYLYCATDDIRKARIKFEQALKIADREIRKTNLGQKSK